MNSYSFFSQSLCRKTGAPRRRRLGGGFSLLEVMMVLVIIATLVTVGTLSLGALLKTENLEKGVKMVKEDILYLRSRAVSVLKNHRFLMTTTGTYVLQEYDVGSTSWVTFSGTKVLPNDVVFRQIDFDDSKDKLEFGTNGLPAFNGAENKPFVTIKNDTAGRRKGIYIEAGGAIYEGAGLGDTI